MKNRNKQDEPDYLEFHNTFFEELKRKIEKRKIKLWKKFAEFITNNSQNDIIAINNGITFMIDGTVFRFYDVGVQDNGSVWVYGHVVDDPDNQAIDGTGVNFNEVELNNLLSLESIIVLVEHFVNKGEE